MPATRESHYDEAARRSSFNGKDLTFIEVLFDVNQTDTAFGATAAAGSPDEFQSPFWRVGEMLRTRGTILAQDFKLNVEATTGDDAAGGGDFTAADNIDVYSFIVEGSDLWGNGEAAQATQIETDVIAALAANGGLLAITGSDAAGIHVYVNTLRFNGDDGTATGVGIHSARGVGTQV